MTAAFIAGCGKSPAGGANANPAQTAKVAAANSYIEAAIVDLLGANTPVLRLAEPGMCPGHYDVRPSQVHDLRNCRVLLRFDFQGSMDDKLAGLTQKGLVIRAIQVGGGICEPTSYLSVCRQTADALIETGLLDRPTADARLARIEMRMRALETDCKQRVGRAGWTNQAVLCSSHQEAFCRWLGLRVAATFTGADAASVGDIEKAIQRGEVDRAHVVIANLPEGRRVADALGARLGVKVIMFGNFPLMTDGGPPFDTLVTSNLAVLLEIAP